MEILGFRVARPQDKGAKNPWWPGMHGGISTSRQNLRVMRKLVRNCFGDAGNHDLNGYTIMLRGLGRSAAFWLDFPSYLVHRTKVIMIDLPGTGLSYHPTGYASIHEISQAVLETITSLELYPCHLVGLSLGGMVAMDLTQKLEHLGRERGTPLVNSLTVMCSSARDTAADRIAPGALNAIANMLLRPEATHHKVAPWLVSKPFLERSEGLIKTWNHIYEVEGANRIAILRQLAAAAQFQAKDLIDNMKTPCHFIASKSDRLAHWQNSKALWEWHGNATFSLIDELGHDITTERPEWMADTVLNFIQNVQNARHTVSLQHIKLSESRKVS